MKKRKIKNSGYSEGGASHRKTTLAAYNPIKASPQSDVDANLNTLRSRSYDLFCNSPVGAAAINRSRTNVIGAGLKVSPKIDYVTLGLTAEEAKDWQRKTFREFELWAKTKSCDLYRKNNFYDMQDIAYLGYLIDGSAWEYEENTKDKEPEPPKPTFEELKERKLNEVNYWTAQKITGGFTSSASGQPVTYDSDKDTQLTMQGICINVNTPLFAEKYPNGCPVRGYAAGKETKDVFMLNANQVLQWQADLSIHIGTCKQEGWLKQAEVESCNTEAELKKIVLD